MATTPSRTVKPPENKMGVQPVGRLLAGMAVPMMISMLVQALYNIVDSIAEGCGVMLNNLHYVK